MKLIILNYTTPTFPLVWKDMSCLSVLIWLINQNYGAQSRFEKLTVAHPIHKHSAFDWTINFNNLFITARYSLFWARWVQSTIPHQFYYYPTIHPALSKRYTSFVFKFCRHYVTLPRTPPSLPLSSTFEAPRSVIFSILPLQTTQSPPWHILWHHQSNLKVWHPRCVKSII